MALRDILVRLDPEASGLARLKLAAELAKRHGARLTGLYISDDTAHQQALERAAQMGLAPAAEMSAVASRIAGALKSRREENRQQFDQALRDAEVLGEWRSHEGGASEVTAQQSRYSDVCIMGQWPGDDAASRVLQGSTERALLLSGRPIVMVPRQARCEAIGRKVVVGWDASRAASRSMNDALAILKQADLVEVVVVNHDASEFAHGEDPGADIAAHLARHGCRVNVTRLEEAAPAADVLCRHALKSGADLIVAGCYGHSRIGEWLLGGATRALLRQTAVPVLMSF